MRSSRPSTPLTSAFPRRWRWRRWLARSERSSPISRIVCCTRTSRPNCLAASRRHSLDSPFASVSQWRFDSITPTCSPTSSMAVSPSPTGNRRKKSSALCGRSSALRAKGVLGFLDLPAHRSPAQSVIDYAKNAAGKFDDVIVLGIGGSALGPIAIRTALLAPNWNALSGDERKGQPRLHVLDNVDPRTISALLQRLDLRRSLFVVTSKSGGTAETMAQYLVVRERLTAAVGDRARDHLVFITDPKSGALRPLSQAEKITALDIPSNGGGRYSVLTPVGTLPAALVGVDVSAMLAA